MLMFLRKPSLSRAVMSTRVACTRSEMISGQPLARSAEQEVPHLALDRAAQQQPEHPAGVHVEAVGRARAPAAEVLELPPALQRLGVALLLDPGDPGRLVVAEPQPRLHGLHLG